MQLKSIKKLTGLIVLKTGLHIGGNKDNIEIGGMDNPIIKHPNTLLPYIPGSSLKGKMRFWMEWQMADKVDKHKGEPHNCGDSKCPICRIFGTTHKEKKYGPTRISIMDADLCEKDKTEYLAGKWELEDKVENRINRLSGSAKDPRHTERVPPEKSFSFTLTYKIFEIDKEKVNGQAHSIDDKNWAYVEDALFFLQFEGLGGSVSRGYGRFCFENLYLDGEPFTLAPKGKFVSLPLEQKIDG
jgi:CRISPR-associated protein Csm3